MLLAIDIGNTETTVGLFAGDRLGGHWRLHSTPHRTPDEWASVFTAHLTQAGHSTQEIRAAIVASVAPPITQSLCEGVESATTRQPVLVDARSKLPIVLDVDEPLTVGADRIVNTLAASHLFKKDTIVVDFDKPSPRPVSHVPAAGSALDAAPVATVGLRQAETTTVDPIAALGLGGAPATAVVTSPGRPVAPALQTAGSATIQPPAAPAPQQGTIIGPGSRPNGNTPVIR